MIIRPTLGFVARLAGLALLLGACAQTEPSRFYTLTPMAEAETGNSSGGRLSIGVGPVDLPEHLNRPQIVTRSSANQFDLAEFDLWAEPLDETFARVLGENLSSLLGTDRVSVFPWSGATPIDYQVTVKVIRFDRDSAGVSWLITRWSVLRDDGAELLTTRKSTFQERVRPLDYPTTVAAMGNTLTAFSREIAAAIRKLVRPAPSS